MAEFTPTNIMGDPNAMCVEQGERPTHSESLESMDFQIVAQKR